MADEQTNPTPTETPEPEVTNTPAPDQPEQEQPTDQGEDQPREGEATEAEPETEEIELEGKRYTIPKDLKGAFLMDRDYRQKTQALADQRRAVEAERAAVAETAKASQQFADGLASLKVIDMQLEQLNQVNWDQLLATDPSEHSRLTRLSFQLTQNRAQQVANLENQHRQSLETQQREFAKRVESANAEMAKQVSNWPEIGPKVEKFIVDGGVNAEELRALATRPHMMKLAHLAFIGAQTIENQRKAAAKPAAPAPQPAASVSGRKAPASNEPRDSDPPDVWLRKRNAQLAGQGRR